MPTYAYRGNECPHEFEAYQSFSDNPLTECIECGLPVRRVIQLPGIVFKGSGWYITDSRTGGEKADKQNPSAKEPATAANGSTDAKPTQPGKAASTEASSSSTATASTATATKD